MKYIPTETTDFDNIMQPIRLNPLFVEKDYRAVETFIDFYDEYCGRPYAIVDEQSVSLVWEDAENTENKHICIITPAKKTVTLQPLEGEPSKKGKPYKFKIDEELLSEIERVTQSWGLTVTPFKPKKEKKVNNKPLKIDTVTINGNLNAKQIPLPKKLRVRISHIDDESRGWVVTANYHKKNGVYINNFSKRKFATPEESVVCAIMEALDTERNHPEWKVNCIEDVTDEMYGTTYSLEDMEQAVFQYIQKQSPSDETVFNLPFFDLSDKKQVETYIEAVKRGELELVKQFFSAGAYPYSFKFGSAKKYRSIDVFDIAIDAKQKEVALAILEHCKAIGEEVYEWQYEEIEKIKNN